MTKQELLRAMHALANKYDDCPSQEALERMQTLIQREMDAEAAAGNITLVKHANGFAHTVDGKPWKHWMPEEDGNGEGK